MGIFEFNQELKNGIKAMDDEHQFLFDAINHAYDLLQKDKSAAYKFFMETIVSYVDQHLNHEETIMRRYNYPDFEIHLRSHSIFRRVIMDLVPAVQSGDPKAFMEVYAISMGWLIGHIEKVDSKYGKWFAEQKVTDEINLAEKSFV